MKLEGKKLLILGATANEIPLIERAHELGIYVIVTDYNLDHRLSPSKDVADEYWDISWSDIDTLADKCIQTGVDGITAGFSEFRVDCMIRLSERLHFPHYVDANQLEITRDKAKFKETCRKYGVPVIREYASKQQVGKFPVIVKPVDRAGSIGVGIAHNAKELDFAYEQAMEKSVSKKVIIEDYITDAVEMDVHYAVCDGEISLLCTDDIIAAAGNKSDGKVVQSVWLYPCRYENEFLKNVDPYMRSMIKGLGILNGTIFFSGFRNGEGDFAFFECGFRLWGEQEFNFNYLKGQINYLDIYLYHALMGSTKGIVKNEHGNEKIKGASINFYVKGGTIGSITGVDEVRANKDCTLALIDGYVGQECEGSKAILTKAALVCFGNESPERLDADVQKTYQVFQIKNLSGEDMVYDRIPVGTIASWWDDTI